MIDGTARLRGLTIGTGTPYGWEEWPTGLLDTAEIREEDEPIARRDGVVPGGDYLGERRVVFSLRIVCDTIAEGEQRIAELTQAFAPDDLDEWLDVRVSGAPSEYALFGRARGVTLDLQSEALRLRAGGVIRARAVFVATDPLRYGPPESAEIILGDSGPGLEYPVEYPIVYRGSSTSGVAAVLNVGARPVDWTATLTGPLTNPRLEHVESGRAIRLLATLGVGETVVLDSASAGILLDGTTPRPRWLAVGSRWFRVPPGPNSIRLTADVGTGSAEFSWRPGWA